MAEAVRQKRRRAERTWSRMSIGRLVRFSGISRVSPGGQWYEVDRRESRHCGRASWPSHSGLASLVREAGITGFRPAWH